MSISSLVNESPIEESQKMGYVIGEDRISNLPESIISHILSRLPTEDVVRTCILSKDWEYKWTSIYNIHITGQRLYSHRNDKTRNAITTFVNFVERILLLSQNIKYFRFSCDTDCNLSGRMTTWISTILRRNVESLELFYGEDGIALPRSLLNNSSLRKLHLGMPFCIFKVPSTNYFPNLTSLCFIGVEFRNEFSNTDTMIFTFPVLERLELSYCQWENVKSVEFFAPSLTSLKYATSDDNVEILNYSIKVFGPKLVKFKSSGGSAVNFIVARPPVVKAVLNHTNLNEEDPELLGNYGLQFRRLLKEFSSLEDLQLTYWVTKAIANAKQGLALPMYHKLKRLFMDVGTNSKGLLELLHSAPFLKILILDMTHYDHDDDYDFDAMGSVPSCMISHLEEIELYYCDSVTDLTIFLLKNGAKLKELFILVDLDDQKDEIMEVISAIPKASTCVSVVVE